MSSKPALAESEVVCNAGKQDEEWTRNIAGCWAILKSEDEQRLFSTKFTAQNARRRLQSERNSISLKFITRRRRYCRIKLQTRF